MRFLIVNTDYPNFLADMYAKKPGLEEASYDEQMRARYDTLFGMADFYSSNLRSLGHEAKDIFFNNYFLQRAWLEEHGCPVFGHSLGIAIDSIVRKRKKSGSLYRVMSLVDLANRAIKQNVLYSVLKQQIRDYRPDVLINLAPDDISPSFFTKSRSCIGFLAGQIAAPVPRKYSFNKYDLMLSSLPNFVDNFRKKGIRSEYLRLGFEPKVLDHFRNGTASGQIPVSFVGSFSGNHSSRTRLFEYIANHQSIQIWGNDAEKLPPDSRIRQVNHGPVWGKSMYQTLRQSRITLNHHIDISGDFANNCRLYESTGTGALLLTDWKKNLDDLFEIDTELVTYKTPEECVEKITYFLEHEKERQAIAAAGQKRTLNDHTYYLRMQELIRILEERKRRITAGPE